MHGERDTQAKIRVDIGLAFWRLLKATRGLRFYSNVAFFFLDALASKANVFVLVILVT